jgi:hypothetical protein
MLRGKNRYFVINAVKTVKQEAILRKNGSVQISSKAVRINQERMILIQMSDDHTILMKFEPHHTKIFTTNVVV